MEQIIRHLAHLLHAAPPARPFPPLSDRTICHCHQLNHPYRWSSIDLAMLAHQCLGTTTVVPPKHIRHLLCSSFSSTCSLGRCTKHSPTTYGTSSSSKSINSLPASSRSSASACSYARVLLLYVTFSSVCRPGGNPSQWSHIPAVQPSHLF